MFLFVNTFPRPPPQPTGQFSAALTFKTVGGVGTIISTVSIAHLAGPTLFDTSSTAIWITSAAKPSAFTGPFTIANGLKGTTSWTIGQTWTLDVSTYLLQVPDNLTISIVASNQLLFHQTVPGSSPSVPPQFTNQGTVPSTPVVGNAFKVFVQISDAYLNPMTPNAVVINYSLLPGFNGASPQGMTYSATNGTFEFRIPASSAPATGTYYVFVTATDGNGLANSIAVPVVIVAPPPSPGSGQVVVSVALDQPAPVVGTPATILASVTDEGASGGAVSVQFVVNAATVGTTAGSVTAGGTTILSSAWTPSTLGTTTIVAAATISGVGSANGTLTITTFPTILLIEHNTAYSGATRPLYGPADESGWLAQALTAAGIPFQVASLNCKTTLPNSLSPLYTGMTVLIVDYGSNSAGGCTNLMTSSNADQTTLSTLSSTHAIWIVGSNAWSTSGSSCSGVTTSAFRTAFGLSASGRSPCATSVALPSTNGGTYTATPASGLRGDGTASPYTVNNTVLGNSTFSADSLANAFRAGAPATTFFTIGGAVAGTFVAGTYPNAVLGVDPLLLARTLPAPGSQAWGVGGAATEVVYNVVDFLSGITTSSSTNANRWATDFAVSEVQLVGTKHSATTTVDAVVRANGLTGSVVTVTLLVNGTPALYGGVVVSSTFYLSGGGTSQFVALLWQAPSAAGFTLSVLITGSNDLLPLNNQFTTGIVQLPTQFT